jgi:hypothetical protein
MSKLKSIPGIGLLLYSVAAILIATCSFLRDGIIWFYAMQAIAWPTSMIFTVLPLPADLARNVDRGLFLAAILVNGVVWYFVLLAITRVVKAIRRKSPSNARPEPTK